MTTSEVANAIRNETSTSDLQATGSMINIMKAIMPDQQEPESHQPSRDGSLSHRSFGTVGTLRGAPYSPDIKRK